MGKCQILSFYDTFVSLGKRKTIHYDLRKTQKGLLHLSNQVIEKGLPYDAGKRDKGASIFLVAL